jgi:putative transposase
VKFAWVQGHAAQFPVDAMCRALGVSTSGYFASRSRPASLRATRRAELTGKIALVHAQSRYTYGSPRVHRELVAQGVRICENSVARLMREQHIRARAKPRFVPRTTQSDHAHPIAENLLKQDFHASEPDQKWVTDITYIRTQEGWLYLAAVIDLFSRKVVGWSMSEHLHAQLVADALRMALGRRKPAPGLLHHSDRGVQYACDDYQKLLLYYRIVCSMSAAGNCYDNAVVESFWATLKTELVYHVEYLTRAQARLSIFEYIEVFYNRVRRHSSLNYVSPEAFEAELN